jgi:hypothetical protein
MDENRTYSLIGTSSSSSHCGECGQGTFPCPSHVGNCIVRYRSCPYGGTIHQCILVQLSFSRSSGPLPVNTWGQIHGDITHEPEPSRKQLPAHRRPKSCCSSPNKGNVLLFEMQITLLRSEKSNVPPIQSVIHVTLAPTKATFCRSKCKSRCSGPKKATFHQSKV